LASPPARKENLALHDSREQRFIGYGPFGVAAIAVDSCLPLKVNETSDLYPLRSMKRAIVEGPRGKIAGLRQAPQSVVVMDVNGAIFPRQVRILSLALVADDLAL
jgi:hypothetical protein